MEDTVGTWCGAPSFLTEQGGGACPGGCVTAGVLGRRGGKRMVAGARCSFALRLG